MKLRNWDKEQIEVLVSPSKKSLSKYIPKTSCNYINWAFTLCLCIHTNKCTQQIIFSIKILAISSYPGEQSLSPIKNKSHILNNNYSNDNDSYFCTHIMPLHFTLWSTLYWLYLEKNLLSDWETCLQVSNTLDMMRLELAHICLLPTLYYTTPF